MTTTKTRPTTAPVAVLYNDGEGAIVTKTHDVEAARDALLAMFQQDAYTDDEALELVQPYLDMEPDLTSGRWVWGGSYDGEPCRTWRDAPLDQRGVTRAVVWSL